MSLHSDVATEDACHVAEHDDGANDDVNDDDDDNDDNDNDNDDTNNRRSETHGGNSLRQHAFVVGGPQRCGDGLV